MASSLMRTKSIEQSIEDTEEPEHQLRKNLSAVDLTVFGIGVIVGTGIFVLTGIAAATHAGPAIALSFVVSGVVCALAALCYAEFASTVPVAGSAYTFSYASLGELIAWIIGWDLMLELALGASTVATGWSKYFVKVIGIFGWTLPANYAGGSAKYNIPAAVIILILTVISIVGIKVSSRVNLVMVIIKLAVVLFVIFYGLTFIKTANWHPFIPPAGKAPVPVNAEPGTPLLQLITGAKPLAYGLTGIITAAAVVFFAYIGFDVVATAAEETKNPQRDLPIGILGSLGICTVLYVAVSLVVTGMAPYKTLNNAAPLAQAFTNVGKNWAANLISIGAICGLTTVILILLLGQARVFFAMSRDHLLPPVFSKVHPRFGTPYLISAITGCVCAVIAFIVPISTLAEMVNIGTLFAFVLVSLGVIVLRRTRPELPRAFHTPFVPVLPVLAALSSFYLMLNLAWQTWVRFGVWMALGMVIYFLYSRHHSRVGIAMAPGGGGRLAQTLDRPGGGARTATGTRHETRATERDRP